jgi:hypothetical protein
VNGSSRGIYLRLKSCIHAGQENFNNTVSYRSPRKFKIGVWQKEASMDKSSFVAITAWPEMTNSEDYAGSI